MTRSRGQSFGAGRSDPGAANQIEEVNLNRPGGTEAAHTPPPNRTGFAALLRSDPNSVETDTSTRAPTNAPIPAAMTSDQPSPSAPITHGDFSRLLDMLESTRNSLEAHKRDSLRMQENMITMSRELSELRREKTPSPTRRLAADYSSSSNEEHPRERRLLERAVNLE